ncbi:hypothetical protein QNH46_24015 [Paenibacillus woosongensis]|uniref:Uncharacterized protein n=1 Tax=Paenibacillus woosongensis TaxID=307580 RepID=A0AA95IF05_9BACL|nr:hypothetical protein [Paenibacillus woosongensis]WHX51618.1 hypothetical protein QNH46_24015 [Paenibacillus woosongensis]
MTHKNRIGERYGFLLVTVWWRNRGVFLYEERLGVLKGETKVSPAEQPVRLYFIDKFWADHLAYVSYIRESIHLTSLVGCFSRASDGM